MKLNYLLNGQNDLNARSNCCCSCRWGETMSSSCGHHWTYCSSRRWYMSMESHDGLILTGKNRGSRRKSCPSATSTTDPTWMKTAEEMQQTIIVACASVSFQAFKSINLSLMQPFRKRIVASSQHFEQFCNFCTDITIFSVKYWWICLSYFQWWHFSKYS